MSGKVRYLSIQYLHSRYGRLSFIFDMKLFCVLSLGNACKFYCNYKTNGCFLQPLASKPKNLSSNRDKLQENIEKLQTDLRTARSSVNEEKSLKLFQERKVKDLESQLNCRDEESDQQVARLNEQLQESNKSSLELHEQVWAVLHP